MWKRRAILVALGSGAAGLALFYRDNPATAGQSSTDDAKHAGMKSSCCDACGDCAKACNKALHHCLQQAAAGKPRHANMAQIVGDCAAFCALSAEMIARQSAMMVLSCRACADACRMCAQECRTFDTDSEMKICLDACERCEESCRNMGKAMGNEPASHSK